MRKAFKQLLGPATGFFVIALMTALSGLGIIELGKTALDSVVLSIFAGIAAAVITDISIRHSLIKEIVRQELKTNLSDSSKTIVLDSESDAYLYLAANMFKCRSIVNTIIHNGAYSSEGVRPISTESKKFTDAKRKFIRSGKGVWHDLISESYLDYVSNIQSNWLKRGKSKYSAWAINHGDIVFSNYTVLNYESGQSEVVLGWIITPDAEYSNRQYLVVSNRHIVDHYIELFNKAKASATKII